MHRFFGRMVFVVLCGSVGGSIQARGQSFQIVIHPGAGLSANADALASFQRAAAQWTRFFSDPITVNIHADFSTFDDPNIIGESSPVMLEGDFDSVRDALIADAGDEPDNGIVAYLPSSSQFTAYTAEGQSVGANLMATKANFKALGYTGLDAAFGDNDASITFNSAFSFDFDNHDGLAANTLCFETVAAHELGHALGFMSAVDYFDWGYTGVSPSLLDLFRFRDGDPASDPSNAAEFSTAARDLVPGSTSIFDDTINEVFMSTGSYSGDGSQASHWKDNLGLGIMDPTLSYGEASQINDNDLRAFDVIGYDAIPEPLSVLMLGMTGGLFMLRRRIRGAMRLSASEATSASTSDPATAFFKRRPTARDRFTSYLVQGDRMVRPL